MDTEKNFAVLIDADNISSKYVKTILDELANYGVATYKRIYGDWTNPSLAGWKAALLDNSIIPMQQYGYTTGKSSTDSAMIIDSMDILYSGKVDGFCIVSSDSDFTRLAARLRESGMTVIGMGEKKTPKPFISACNLFKYLDVLYSDEKKLKNSPKEETPPKKTGRDKSRKEEPETEEQTGLVTGLETITEAVVAMVEEESDEDGWMLTGELGSQLAKRYPDFDLRNFGYKRLTPFLKSLGVFDIKSVKLTRDSNHKLVYIKLRDKNLVDDSI